MRFTAAALDQRWVCWIVGTRAANNQSVFTIKEKAPTKAASPLW